MASSIIRSAVRAELAAGFPSVAVVDVLARNVNTEQLPDLWMGLEFDSGSQFRVAIGQPSLWRETGTAYVAVMGKAGGGDGPVSAQADAVVARFRNWYVNATNVRTVSVEVQTALNQDSEGRWFYLVVAVTYERLFYA